MAEVLVAAHGVAEGEISAILKRMNDKGCLENQEITLDNKGEPVVLNPQVGERLQAYLLRSSLDIHAFMGVDEEVVSVDIAGPYWPRVILKDYLTECSEITHGQIWHKVLPVEKLLDGTYSLRIELEQGSLRVSAR